MPMLCFTNASQNDALCPAKSMQHRPLEHTRSCATYPKRLIMMEGRGWCKLQKYNVIGLNFDTSVYICPEGGDPVGPFLFLILGGGQFI